MVLFAAEHQELQQAWEGGVVSVAWATDTWQCAELLSGLSAGWHLAPSQPLCCCLGLGRHEVLVASSVRVLGVSRISARIRARRLESEMWFWPVYVSLNLRAFYEGHTLLQFDCESRLRLDIPQRPGHHPRIGHKHKCWSVNVCVQWVVRPICTFVADKLQI